MCVCVRERERESERASNYNCVLQWVCVYVCVRKWESKQLCVCPAEGMCVCVCEREREQATMCVSCAPDPINHWCSRTGKQISGKYFTYRSVQTFEILFQGLYSPGSDPPHKMMRYWLYYSTLLSCWFPPDQYDQAEIFCTSEVPVPRGQIGGAGRYIFLHDS